ncbi:hypothetical protein QO239_22885 [Cupriavidus taiwanensis]|uniref:hypothetical protein n=1 Tax=Cupriavidus taiwanensis TaxID=164546 RepID=UPI00254020AA|nr:hypothetical protein [Cupriavidus taiwanensis]MDK3025448.1 hypothetical protein [Cupriavidus taiwanensis]
MSTLPPIQGSAGFWDGFYAGIFAAMFAFALAVAWDFWKSWRADKKRDETVVTGLRHELEANVQIATENARTLTEEVDALAGGQTIVDALSPFDTSMRAFVAIGIPSCFKQSAEAFDRYRKVVLIATQLNEDFRSRQAYKDGYHHPNGDPAPLRRRLAAVDAMLLGRITELQQLMTELKTLLA